MDGVNHYSIASFAATDSSPGSSRQSPAVGNGEGRGHRHGASSSFKVHCRVNQASPPRREGSRRAPEVSVHSPSTDKQQKKQFHNKSVYRPNIGKSPPMPSKAYVPSRHAPDSCFDDDRPMRQEQRPSQRRSQISPTSGRGSNGPIPSLLYLKKSPDNISELSLFTANCAHQPPRQRKSHTWEQRVFRPGRPQLGRDASSPRESPSPKLSESSSHLIYPVQGDVLLEELFAQGIKPEEGSGPDLQDSVYHTTEQSEILLEDLYSKIKISEANVTATTADSNSVESGDSVDFMPPAEDFPPSPSRTRDSDADPKRSSQVKKTNDQNECRCQSSMFSGNVEQIEFYLPKLSMECKCGKQSQLLEMDNNQKTIEKILRPWQVGFLKSLGITTAVELIEAHSQSGNILVKEMKRWRKENDLVAFNKEARRAALHIWSRVCKLILLGNQRQFAEGRQDGKRPQVLEIGPPKTSVSTLGVGSLNEMEM